MTVSNEFVEKLKAISRTSAFNELIGLEVTGAAAGYAELSLQWRTEFGQYAGFLHAGMVAALIDTACGFAAVTTAPKVLSSHFSVNCLRPAIAKVFIAQGKVVKMGRRQIFTSASIYGDAVSDKTLLATGETILMTLE